MRVGLVGRNGSGKSTFLKAIKNSSLLDSGSISILKDFKVGYMPQEVVLNSNQSILEETLNAFEKTKKIKDRLQALESNLSKATESELTEYYNLQEQITQIDSEKEKVKAIKILNGIGFKEDQFDQPVSNLSVGWKMRIVLAKLLLQEADFYLFDEPTNHLDLIAKEWFLSFLNENSFGFLLVCHEKYFLDQLCNQTFELDRGNGKIFKGNYSNYIEQKEEDLVRLQNAYLNQQKEIKRKQETINKFRAKSSKARMAQSMIKSLEKILTPDNSQKTP